MVFNAAALTVCTVGYYGVDLCREGIFEGNHAACFFKLYFLVKE
jgi:hypothetical protein